jgi:hypothetical protein
LEYLTVFLLDLERPQTWPSSLLSCLSENYEVFLGWGSGDRPFHPQRFDAAICEIMDVIRPYGITGWHCTRLTDAEVEIIFHSGMQLPNLEMLCSRIDALTFAGKIQAEIAQKLKVGNKADKPGRAGMIWFCFFPPRIAGECGIRRFFRHWGGEALYNSHEGDPITSPVLNAIGTPCVVEADVPIASLPSCVGLSYKLVRRYLISRGLVTGEPVDHEDRITVPLAAKHVRRVIKHPEPEFMELTGCCDWDFPVGKLHAQQER